MGKKCVQAVGTARTTLGINQTYTQYKTTYYTTVGKYSVQSPTLRQTIHILRQVADHIKNGWLYPVSTQPITTTKCLKNKKTEIIAAYN